MQKSAKKLLKIRREIHLVPYIQITYKKSEMWLQLANSTRKYFTGKHQTVTGYYNKAMTGAPSKFFSLNLSLFSA